MDDELSVRCEMQALEDLDQRRAYSGYLSLATAFLPAFLVMCVSSLVANVILLFPIGYAICVRSYGKRSYFTFDFLAVTPALSAIDSSPW